MVIVARAPKNSAHFKSHLINNLTNLVIINGRWLTDWLTGGGNAGNKYVQLGHNAMCDHRREQKWKERSNNWNQSSFKKKNKKKKKQRNKSKWSKSSKGQAIIIIITIIALRGQSGPNEKNDDQLGGERERVDASASAVMNGRRRCHCLQSVWKLMDWLKVIGWLVTAGQLEKWKVCVPCSVITINSQQGRQIDCLDSCNWTFKTF